MKVISVMKATVKTPYCPDDLRAGHIAAVTVVADITDCL